MTNSTDPLHGLFTGRTAEGVAGGLAVTLAWLTECQMATLEGLEGKKSTPKGELNRQREICERAVAQCVDLGLKPGIRGLRGFPCPRLDAALKAASHSKTTGSAPSA